MTNSNAEIITAAVYEDNPQVQAALLGKLSSFQVDSVLLDEHMHSLAGAVEEFSVDAADCKGLGDELKVLGIFDGGVSPLMSDENAIEAHPVPSVPSL